MVNEAPASAIRRRRHRSMFTVWANWGSSLVRALLDLVELALVILGERHDPFLLSRGWAIQLWNGASRNAQVGRR